MGRLCAFVAGLLPSVSGVLSGSVDQEYPWQADAAHAFFALSCPQVTWIVIYPLVNVYITNWKDPPFLWVNPLFLWSFSIANCNKLPEGINPINIPLNHHKIPLNHYKSKESNKLTIFPEGILKAAGLSTLDLSNNDLTHVPPELGGGAQHHVGQLRCPKNASVGKSMFCFFFHFFH